MNQSHTPILNQASWGSIQLGWGGTIVVFSQNNGMAFNWISILYLIGYDALFIYLVQVCIDVVV